MIRSELLHSTRVERFMRLAILTGIAVSLSGCLLSLGGHRHLSGAELPMRLPLLSAGASRDQVVELLGAPESTGEDSTRLRWTETLRPRACRMYILGFIPLGREPRVIRRVDATFANGQLVDANVTYLDRRGVVVTSTESLVAPSPGTQKLP